MSEKRIATLRVIVYNTSVIIRCRQFVCTILSLNKTRTAVHNNVRIVALRFAEPFSFVGVVLRFVELLLLMEEEYEQRKITIDAGFLNNRNMGEKRKNGDIAQMYSCNGGFSLCSQRDLHEPACQQDTCPDGLDRFGWRNLDIMAVLYVYGHYHKAFRT